MTRPHPRHAPPLMPAQSAFANSRRTPMDRRRLSCGRAVAMHCTWVVWPIWLLISGSCAVLHAGRHGRPQPPRPSRALAAHTVSPLRNRPQITTLPRASTTRPLHPDPQPTSCRSVARGSFWRTRRMLPRMLLGKSYLTGTCTGRPSTHGKLAAGRPSGFACAAIPASMNTTRCCKACRHRPPAPRTVLAGSPSTCASSAADGCVAAGALLRFSRALAKGCRSPTHRMPHLQIHQRLLAQVPDRPTRRRRLHRTMRRGTTRAHRADSTTGEHTAGCLCRYCMPLWAASTPPR